MIIQKHETFYNTTRGTLTLSQVREQITLFMNEGKDSAYDIIVGTDSQKKQKNITDFVTAIVVHRIGSGGIYFWNTHADSRKRALKERIFEEATLSLMTAQKLVDLFKSNGNAKIDVQIHVDVGTKGPTRTMIQEVVGMIRGSGFVVKTKPDSFGATSVADRHT